METTTTLENELVIFQKDKICVSPRSRLFHPKYFPERPSLFLSKDSGMNVYNNFIIKVHAESNPNDHQQVKVFLKIGSLYTRTPRRKKMCLQQWMIDTTLWVDFRKIKLVTGTRQTRTVWCLFMWLLRRCRLVYSDLKQISTYRVGRGSKDKITKGHMKAGGKGRKDKQQTVSHVRSSKYLSNLSEAIVCVVFKVMTVWVD